MGSSGAKPISAAQYAQLEAFQPSASALWNDFTAHVVDQREAFRETLSFADTVLNLRIGGTCRLRQEADGRSLAGRSGPGSIHVTPARMSARWECSAASEGSRVIAMFVPHAFLARAAEEAGFDARRLEIAPRFLIRDRVLESVLTRLVLEAQHGSPSGRLYADHACEFLAHHLLHTFSSYARPPAPASGGLSTRRLRAVLDFIEESLSQQISLRQLADLAQVSPRHFERAFRRAVGSPPYAYVIEKRVAAARALLLSQPTLTVETIATRVGFSSSSHLALAFRRLMGCSPAAFRRLHQDRAT